MSTDVLWRPDTDPPRPPLLPGDVYRSDILAVIDQTIDDLRPQLRELSDKIRGKAVKILHPDNIVSDRTFPVLYMISSSRGEVQRTVQLRLPRPR